MLYGISFYSPQFLYLLIVIPILVAFRIWRRKRTVATIDYSNTDLLSGVKKTFRQRMFFLPFTLRMLILTVLIVALARPQSSFSGRSENVEGIDIMLTMDISSSMLAEDFSPNRLEAAKKVAKDFIASRKNDRMGIVIFSGECFTQCPLTIDHNILNMQLDGIHIGMLEDGTAIGEGLATAINRLRSSEAISKTIILLTDGINNRGSIDPISGAEMAKTFGIRVYTIGVGTHGMAPYPVQTPFGKQYQNQEVQIDENMLKDVAKITGAQYFRATNRNNLKTIFDDIDKLEKTKIEITAYEHKSEEFKLLLWIALALFCIELLLRLTIYKQVP